MNHLLELYKNHSGKSSDKWRSYLTCYEKILEKCLDNKGILVEVGLQNGGSLELWAKYFTNARKIIGVDIDERVKDLSFEDHRINVLVGDAASPEILDQLDATLDSEIDLVIDDGSHRSSDIIKTFSLIFPLLKDGGIYIVEDLHCSYWKEWEGGLFAPNSSIGFFKKLIDILNFQHWGVDLDRLSIVQPFASQYGVKFSENTLASIQGITFENSLCIIRKNTPDGNLLGERIIVGNEFPLADNAHVRGSLLESPSQRENELSDLCNSLNAQSGRSVSPYNTDDLLREIEQLKATLIEKDLAFSSYEVSTKQELHVLRMQLDEEIADKSALETRLERIRESLCVRILGRVSKIFGND